MKKITYFRAIKNKSGFDFQACEGYHINFYNGSGAIDLVFGKNQYNLWTITELSTGFLVHNSTFLTRKEAIQAITADYLKLIFSKIKNAPFIEAAAQRLNEYRAKNHA